MNEVLWESMSWKNGDKARAGRLKKQKTAKRLRDRALRARLLGQPAAAGSAPTTAESAPTALPAENVATERAPAENDPV